MCGKVQASLKDFFAWPYGVWRNLKSSEFDGILSECELFGVQCDAISPTYVKPLSNLEKTLF
ncbi:hypothetical protein DPMN_137749 [Dreissena polymorpha]|uniref:Uncharacterized protein n=1 Tax=Dreissena polymorpha TaxID=45954 RepID=A0A9D4G330_DREPO|nr:hypothetical protein DPMN_137749 [Dreissena polymorpha]